jgi:hypothetical protein
VLDVFRGEPGATHIVVDRAPLAVNLVGIVTAGVLCSRCIAPFTAGADR